MVTIAVDAMGGDKAPVPEVEGAIHAATQYGHRVLLVGDEPAVERELESHDPSAICRSKSSTRPSASRWTITPRKPRVARRKARCTSARVWSQPGKADGFLSAGNTGACMAIAKMVLGKAARRRPPCAHRRFSDASKERPWWWSMSAPTWIASRRCSRNSA